MLEATQLRQQHAGRIVLDVPSLRLELGARLAVVGPNGAGKSTLLRLLAFLDRPASGTLALDEKPVVTQRQRRRARRRVTLVEQRPFLFRGTVLDNVAWGQRARGASAEDARRAALDALTLLQAKTLAARDARTLSEGEIQRVAVARALAIQPDVLLLDEPVSGADRAAQHALYTAITTAQGRRPMAVCVASHLLEDAYRWADTLLALLNGVPTPVTPENLFRVELSGGNPEKVIPIGPLMIEVVTDREGPATLAIAPEDILLSIEPLHSSARNVIEGRVVRVSEQGPAMRVTVAAAGGIELVSLITRRSFEELGLSVGGSVYAAFKSVAVRVF
ncbi:MAG: ATP-binding cassette domain-containing protein [Gemmatimonadales bacterium]